MKKYAVHIIATPSQYEYLNGSFSKLLSSVFLFVFLATSLSIIRKSVIMFKRIIHFKVYYLKNITPFGELNMAFLDSCLY